MGRRSRQCFARRPRWERSPLHGGSDRYVHSGRLRTDQLDEHHGHAHGRHHMRVRRLLDSCILASTVTWREPTTFTRSMTPTAWLTQLPYDRFVALLGLPCEPGASFNYSGS